MSTELIPKEWKEAVCAILKTHDRSLIPLTNSARCDWESAFPEAWFSDLYDLAHRYLSQHNVEGRLAKNMIPPGVAYEFICVFNGRNVLIKINLTENGKVHIVSAHIPRKGNTL
jgi:hypothetical protein